MTLLPWNFKSCMVINILYLPPISYFPSNSHSLLRKARTMVVPFPKTMVASGSNNTVASCSNVMVSRVNTMALFPIQW